MLYRLGAGATEGRVLRRMMMRGLNSPLTSSCGRLFDAVAAVVLGRREVDYEAQAAIELEGLAIDEPYDSGKNFGYAMEWTRGNWESREPTRIDTGLLWHELMDDLRRGVSKARIAARFHAGVAAAFVRVAMMAREATGLRKVVLSGGCMHNRRLVRLLRMGLEAEGLDVLQHTRVSPGDGGLSYGQAVVAAAKMESPRP